MRAELWTSLERVGRFPAFRPSRFSRSAVLAVALVLLLCAPALAFSDTAGHPYADAIDDLSSREIINGFEDATFVPNKLVMRQQFAKMIVGTMGLTPTEQDVCPFPDVSVSGATGLYPDNFVALAAAKGITTGYTDGHFRPGDNISRAQVLTMVVRAADNLAPGTLNPTPAGFKATWGSFDPTHASNAAKAEANGLLAGMPVSSLDPWGKMPRGEVAQVLHNLLDTMSGGDRVVEIIEGYVPERLDLPHLGDMEFATDPSVPAARATATWDKETVLRLTDSDGLEWELKVPMGSVFTSTEISMKALKDLESENIPGTLAGGVSLEPDGLQFAVPATLTVRGKDLGPRTIMLTGKHDGSEVDFGGTESRAGAVSAPLFHFSTAAATQARMETEWEDMQAAAGAQAAALLKEAKELNKKPIRFPPPPSVELECAGDEAAQKGKDEAISKWVNAALEPERDLQFRLLTVAKDMSLMGLEYQPLLDAAGGLSVRGLWKAEKLLAAYPKDRDKILPISRFVATALGNYQVYGGEDQSLFAELAGWLQSFIDDMISDIRTKHDYRLARTALTVAAMAGITGADVDGDDLVDKIEAAMRFRLETKLTLDGPTEQWILEGETYLDGFLSSGLRGSMPGRYVSLTHATERMIGNPTFTANVRIDNFDPCQGTAQLLIDRYWADEEYYTVAGDPWPAPWMLVNALWTLLFGEPAEDGGGYAFPLVVRNLEVNAVDELIQKSDAPVAARFEVKLVHDPR